MINNDDQLRRTREALLDLESAMTALYRKKDQIHPDRFAIMAEPIIDDIRNLRGDIDAYTGVTAATAADVPPKDEECVEGILREIDLDARTFTIRHLEGGKEVRCQISDENDGLLEIAKDALDNCVKVVGIRQHDSASRKSFPLQVREIDILDKDVDETVGTCESVNAQTLK